MIAADLGRAALFASVPVCSALHVLTLAQLFAVTFGAGALSVLFNVSDSTLFVSIVAPERYMDAQSLIYGSRALSFLGSAFFLGRIRPAEPPVSEVGVLIGAGAIGAVLGSLVTKRLAARIGTGWAYAAGCLLYAAPLVLWPLAHGAMPLVLAMLFAAEFVSGFGLMVLDITIGVIFAAIIPDTLRSRVTGAFQAVNYGTRPLGALLGGLLGSVVGLRPALWVATLGGVAGFALLLPTPLPRYRLPAVDGPARA
jgi:MFS family permease